MVLGHKHIPNLVLGFATEWGKPRFNQLMVRKRYVCVSLGAINIIVILAMKKKWWERNGPKTQEHNK